MEGCGPFLKELSEVSSLELHQVDEMPFHGISSNGIPLEDLRRRITSKRLISLRKQGREISNDVSLIETKIFEISIRKNMMEFNFNLPGGKLNIFDPISNAPSDEEAHQSANKYFISRSPILQGFDIE